MNTSGDCIITYIMRESRYICLGIKDSLAEMHLIFFFTKLRMADKMWEIYVSYCYK